MKIYGPYTSTSKRSLGRLFLILREDNKNKTISYPKWLMQEHLGRELTLDETVDHIDGNFLNNNINNLQILSRSNHSKKDTIKVELIEITYILCGKKEKKKPKDLNHNSKRGKAGPFCGKSCAGRYGTEIQNNRMEKLPIQPEVPIKDRKYYK